MGLMGLDPDKALLRVLAGNSRRLSETLWIPLAGGAVWRFYCGLGRQYPYDYMSHLIQFACRFVWRPKLWSKKRPSFSLPKPCCGNTLPLR